MFVAPVIGGFLIDISSDIIFPFYIRFILTILSLLFLIMFVKEPEISGMVLKPIKNVFTTLSRVSTTRIDTFLNYGRKKGNKS